MFSGQRRQPSNRSAKVSRGKFRRSWYDDEVKAAVAERRAAHSVFLQASTEETGREFRRMRNRCKRLIAGKKKEDWEKLMQQIQDAYKSNQRQL